MNIITTNDTQILADAGWREKANLQCWNACVKAGSDLPIVRMALSRMMALVPNGEGQDALDGFRRCLAVIGEIEHLPSEHRAVLAGELPLADTMGLNVAELLIFRARRVREVFRSNPVLDAAYRDWELSEVGERLAREKVENARIAAINAEENRRVEIVSAVTDMARRGVKLHVAAGGKAIAWPKSLMTDADQNILRESNGLLAQVIFDEWAH